MYFYVEKRPLESGYAMRLMVTRKLLYLYKHIMTRMRLTFLMSITSKKKIIKNVGDKKTRTHFALKL